MTDDMKHEIEARLSVKASRRPSLTSAHVEYSSPTTKVWMIHGFSCERREERGAA